MARSGLVAALLAALALAACGSNGPSGLTGAQRQGLLTRVELIRQAAGAGDLATTQRRLRGLGREVGRLERSGAIDAKTAAALLLAASRANAQATKEVVPPPPQPAQTTPAQPAQALPPGQAKKEKRGKGGKHGKPGKGDE